MTTSRTRPVSAEDPDSMPTVREYFAADPRTPQPLLDRSSSDLDQDLLDKSCFISSEWHDREVERLWGHVWQMACRENDIPAVGDYLEYRIADQTVVIVRDTGSSIRAFHNACLHRGTALVEGSGTKSSLQCSFHGWTWNLDGSLHKIPCAWDFPIVDAADYRLPEVRVGTWNGFVFINFDPDAESLDEFLGPDLQRHFEQWPLDHRWKAIHVVKRINCNWKVALEAFMEDYHVFRTHTNMIPYAADCNSQYDMFGRHHRMITAMGVPSPHSGDQYEPQDTVEAMINDMIADVARDSGAEIPIPPVPPQGTSREVLADFMRTSMGQRLGIDFTGRSTPEVLDAIQYHVFPNFMPWGGFTFPFVYRFRPADHPDWCDFDVIIMAPFPEKAEMPRDTPARMLPPDEPWAAAPELAGGLGKVYDEDMVNLPKVQRGLHTAGLKTVVFAKYQERNIRHFHQELVRFMAD